MKEKLKSESQSRWYLTTILMVLTIENVQRKIVHKNLHLIQAESDDVAYDKAIKLGNDSETSYLNSKNQSVNISFYGLAELEETTEFDIYDGVELRFDEFENLSSAELKSFVPLKKDLSVFSFRKSILKENQLDYGSKEVRKLVRK